MNNFGDSKPLICWYHRFKVKLPEILRDVLHVVQPATEHEPPVVAVVTVTEPGQLGAKPGIDCPR
jgi:hypothetical protein